MPLQIILIYQKKQISSKLKKIYKMDDPDVSRRRIISSVISNICLNAGFIKTEIFALETLAEMFTTCKRFKSNIDKNY